VTVTLGSAIFIFIKVRERKLKQEKIILETKVKERTVELQTSNENLDKVNKIVEQKNRDITASINYAHRIQDAILPGSRNIRDIFPDSFMFYKIKDVVSGDFPWILKKGDDVFVTTIDCTGHGIPGAMLSMIAHFLLNEIVIGRKVSEPAEILNQLHKGVNHTLQQDKNIESRDGMDVAMCKINLKSNGDPNNLGEVQYAGAHLSLLHITNGELHETPGNRFPVGGVQYSSRGKRIEFTNHTINIKKGDAIYCFSDGIADQIGGTKNRKLMNARVQELIMENNDFPMAEACNRIEESFSKWMGNNKQIDDVLMIGIKF